MKSTTAKNVVTVLLIICLINITVSTDKHSYEISYISVPVDHFSFTSNATFNLRYLINDSHWGKDGPIFFYTGNEGSIDTFAQNTGFMWEIAPDFRALLVFAEHRYYGESLPFGNKSFCEPKYLGYLSSSQALADFVYLIDFLQINRKCFTDARPHPVIAFGGSYGGMLSAWLRMKYPNSVLGAIASSAPIWQFEGLVSCGIFNRIITFVFGISSCNDCSLIISKSWSAIREVTSTPEGKKWLSSEWKLCKPLETEVDIHTLMDWLDEVYGNLAMVNYPYPANFIVPLPAYPVKAFCNKLHNNTSSNPKCLLKNLGNALTVYTNYTQNALCVDISESPNGNLGDKGWDFQACTEMIMPMCSDRDDMFEDESWNFTKFSEECYDKWKVRITRPDWTILEYGGKDLKAASNIVFSNGLLDPWSGGGVLNDISDSIVAVVIPDAAHHLDLRASNPADPASVVAARDFHQGIIYRWLRMHYQKQLNL